MLKFKIGFHSFDYWGVEKRIIKTHMIWNQRPTSESQLPAAEQPRVGCLLEPLILFLHRQVTAVTPMPRCL